MFTEKEFGLIRMVNDNPLIKREHFDSDDEFDYSCALALEMLERGILRARSEKPYIINNTGRGPKYVIVGKLHLSVAAQDVIKFADFRAYSKRNVRRSQWGLDNRLTLLGIFVGLLGVVAAIVLAK